MSNNNEINGEDIFNELKIDFEKIFNAFRDDLDGEKLCPMIDPDEARSNSRAILHSIFFNAYLTSLRTEKYNNTEQSFVVRAGVSEQHGDRECKNEICPYLVGFSAYRYLAKYLQEIEYSSKHFVFYKYGRGKDEIIESTTGCGFIHRNVEETINISSMVDTILFEIQNSSEDFFKIVRKIDRFIEESNFGNSSRRVSVYRVNGERHPISLNVPRFDDDTIFSKRTVQIGHPQTNNFEYTILVDGINSIQAAILKSLIKTHGEKNFTRVRYTRNDGSTGYDENYINVNTRGLSKEDLALLASINEKGNYDQVAAFQALDKDLFPMLKTVYENSA